MGMDTRIETTPLLRLMAWLSPSFPVGAYSYSHGIEYAVETGWVTDRESLRHWIGRILRNGAGQTDAALFRAAHEAVTARDTARLLWALEYGDAWRATRELGLESANQGEAFMTAVGASWPAAGLDWGKAQATASKRPCVYPVAVGMAAAAHEVPLSAALSAYLQAFAANLVSAGLRLIPLGQTEGQNVLAALEKEVLEATAEALERPLEDTGQATWMVDWTSARHETQYTRLFRS